jgi:hypothetical protein
MLHEYIELSGYGCYDRGAWVRWNDLRHLPPRHEKKTREVAR